MVLGSPRRFVLDASATLAWLLNESDHADRIGTLLKDGSPVAPWLWRLEVVNTMLIRERRKDASEAVSQRLLELLEDLGVEIVGEPPKRHLNALAQIARPHQLTAYDAVYLELTISLGLPLLTLDKNLMIAAERSGIEMIT